MESVCLSINYCESVLLRIFRVEILFHKIDITMIIYTRNTYMNTFLNFKNAYLQAFKESESPFFTMILRIYSIFNAILILIAVYAFLYRVFTGFEF